MYIRTAALGNLNDIAAAEAACFPPADAAGRKAFAQRLSLSQHGGAVWHQMRLSF